MLPQELSLTDKLRRLGDLTTALEDPAFEFGRWEGGDTRPDGAITMPYYELSKRGLEVVRALPVEPFDWPQWMQTDEAQAFFADHSRIGQATAEQLVKLSTAVVRGDRFNEGTLEHAFGSGMLLAIARRAYTLSRP